MAKPTSLAIVCKGCLTTRNISLTGPFGNNGSILPRTCPVNSSCPLDPWVVVPERSTCVDQQTLKLQELPESVPVGELPRHLLLVTDRYHTGIASPGKRFLVTGIYSLMTPSGKFNFKIKILASKGNGGGGVALRFPYLKVLGLESLVMADMPRPALPLTDTQERRFTEFARSPMLYERIARSIAPSLYGHDGIFLFA